VLSFYSHSFKEEMPLATSCRLACHINVSHLANIPHTPRNGSWKWPVL